MPLATWPVGLPVDPLTEGYDESFADVVLRTAMEAGPPKKRPRSSAAVKPLTVKFDLTRAQVAILEDFHWITLGRGALNFEFMHPRKQVTVEVGFMRAPKTSPVRSSHGARWDAVCELEVYP